MQKKIKFSMVSETDIRYGGGTEKTLLNFFKYLDREKVEPFIFDTNVLDKERLSDNELKIYYSLDTTIKFRYPEFISNLLRNKKMGLSVQKKKISKDLFLIYSILIKFAFLRIFNRDAYKRLMESDVIYAVSDYQLIYLFINKLFKKKYPIIIFGTHNYLPIERRIINKFENLLLKKITEATHYTSIAIYNLSNIKRKDDFIINSGVNTSIFYPSKNSSGKIKFLFVGRLVEYKGIKELIQAWKFFNHKENAELHIVGTGELEDYVIEESKNDESIHFYGFVKEDELPLIYRECHILVFPTYGIKHDEYFGLVVIEALASGEYVILSEEMKGIFDYFNEKNALEYVKLDPKIISERMEFAFKNIENLKKNVLDVRKYIEENYDWKNISLKLSEKIYEIYLNYKKD
ncbi:MAG: glycosyltransferase family 4 protein [Thermoplasmata archaeon]|nr:glycosyltransferase family 4 protein [Thermoplasmata archaeon]